VKILSIKYGVKGSVVRFSFFIFTLILPICVGATELPSAQDIQKAQQHYQDKMRQFKQEAVVVPSMPNMSQISMPKVNHSLNEIFQKAKQPIFLTKAKQPYKLLVFASFSMPKTSLKRLVRQTALAGGTVLMRGLVSDHNGKPSFKATQLKVSALKLDKKQGFAIDPTIFKKYHIEKIPAFIIEHTGLDIVYGDVSLDYALKDMLNHSSKNKGVIQPYLQQLQHRGFFK